MGTMLQQNGLAPGQNPEILCLTAPDTVTAIHAAYAQAGADVVYANTFGANPYKLKRSGYTVDEIIEAAVACAKKGCAGTSARVALDVGPIGQLLEPYGTLRFEDAYEMFAQMMRAGVRAGVDLIAIETMTDLYEIKAAVLAAKENTDLPVFATMSFEAGGRTFTGCPVQAMATLLGGLGVDAMGVNCSLGPRELLPIVQTLCSMTELPIIVKANAGLPNPVTGSYDIGPDEFAAYMQDFLNLGVGILGGCCGTTPDYIRAIRARTDGQRPAMRTVEPASRLCTATRVVEVDGVRVIGERINPTGKKRMQQALREGDMEYILEQAAEQADAGADILDVNVGLPGLDEPAKMAETVKAVQSVTDLPLQIDASDPAAIEAGLRAVCGKAIVNSVNGEAAVLERVLPLVKKYGAAVVGLAMDENGIPPTAEGRFQIAARILQAAVQHGIPKEDVFIDCLTLTVSAEQDKARETLRAVQMVREKLGLHCVLGVSNISFGLPGRDQLTAGFLTLALAHGLDLPIVNPNRPAIMDAIRVFNVLYGRDPNAEAYIAACAGQGNGPGGPAAPAAPETPDPSLTLEQAVEKGRKEEARRLTQALLDAGTPEIEVVNQRLIPSLDAVGARFESGEIFLPQLINAAGAAQQAFDLIRSRIAQSGAPDVRKGKILVATVKGDIHDIGKNIVKTILENYGYQVIDLGRDVPVETVVRTAQEQGIGLIGLSALMTTTLDSMEQTIRALRQAGHPCKIWVGGAVLTPEYAEKMGADFYARDAKESVDIARAVLG